MEKSPVTIRGWTKRTSDGWGGGKNHFKRKSGQVEGTPLAHKVQKKKSAKTICGGMMGGGSNETITDQTKGCWKCQRGGQTESEP